MSDDDDRLGGHRWYPPEMQHVPFPTAQAGTARDVCARVAGLLTNGLMARADLVATARDGWEGQFRRDFDETWATYEANLTGVKDGLESLAAALSMLSANATWTNQQREAMRDEYDATHPMSRAY